jgi:hypothetical protein
MGIETALMGAGIGLQAYGAYQNSEATAVAYAAQAQVNRNNAMIADWQAEDALARGDRDASNVRLRARQLKGTQRARMAANGVDLGTGSALNILADTDYFADIDAGTVKDNAAREAWAIRNQAMGFRAEANLLQSRSDSESPFLAGATSLLGSAGRVASQWYTPTRKT